MSRGYRFYPCMCGGEILEEWDHSSSYFNCNKCENPTPPDCFYIIGKADCFYIIGKAGSGKDYISDIIKEMYPGYTSIAIAEPLYELAEALKNDNMEEFTAILKSLGFANYQVDEVIKMVSEDINIDEIKDNLIKKPRKALQSLGDIVRSIDKYSLIFKALRKSIGPVIITDVRLPLEGAMLKSVGYKGLKILVDDDIRKERLKGRDNLVKFSNDMSMHPTETKTDDIVYDFEIINNNNSRENLNEQLSKIIKTIN